MIHCFNCNTKLTYDIINELHLKNSFSCKPCRIHHKFKKKKLNYIRYNYRDEGERIRAILVWHTEPIFWFGYDDKAIFFPFDASYIRTRAEALELAYRFLNLLAFA